MGNVVNIRSNPKRRANVGFLPIWTGAPGEDGDFVYLAHEKWEDDEPQFYTIMYVNPLGEGDIVERLPYLPEYEKLALFCAGLADKTLSCVVEMTPLDDEEEACNE